MVRPSQSWCGTPQGDRILLPSQVSSTSLNSTTGRPETAQPAELLRYLSVMGPSPLDAKKGAFDGETWKAS